MDGKAVKQIETQFGEFAEVLSPEELQRIYEETYGDSPIKDDYQLVYYQEAFGSDPPVELMELGSEPVEGSKDGIVREMQAAREAGVSDVELARIYDDAYGKDAPITDENQLAIYQVVFGEDPPSELMESSTKTKDVEFGSILERALALGMSKEEIVQMYRDETRRAYHEVHREFRLRDQVRASKRQAELASGDVARIQAEVAKPITGARKRKIPSSQVMAYRDARDRAKRAAEETCFDGLADLVRQARQ